MFRFVLSFLAGFGIVYYLLKRDNEKITESNKNHSPLKFPPEPEGLEDKDKFFNLVKTFNKMKNNI